MISIFKRKFNHEHLLGITSAPGKCIISGEHSVCYGGNCLTFAIEKRCYVFLRITENNSHSVSVNFLNMKKKYFLNSEELNAYFSLTDCVGYLKDNIVDDKNILMALDVIIYASQKYLHFMDNNLHLSYIIKSEIPIGSGLGSSGAFCSSLTCILHVMHYRYFKDIHKKLCAQDYTEIISEARNLEDKFHGKSSGVDTTTSIVGSFLNYSLGSYEKVSVSRDILDKLNFVLIDSGQPKNTKVAVSLVSKSYNDSVETKNIIKRITEITNEIIKILTDKSNTEIDSFLRLINENHHMLKKLNLSTKEIDAIIDSVSLMGCTGKITGAGLGGNVLIIVPKNFEKELLISRLEEMKSNGLFKSYLFSKASTDGIKYGFHL